MTRIMPKVLVLKKEFDNEEKRVYAGKEEVVVPKQKLVEMLKIMNNARSELLRIIHT